MLNVSLCINLHISHIIVCKSYKGFRLVVDPWVSGLGQWKKNILPQTIQNLSIFLLVIILQSRIGERVIHSLSITKYTSETLLIKL